MRKLSTFLLLISISNTLYIIPSQALFGPSKCEKVLKQVTDIEVKIQSNLRFQRTGIGKLISINSIAGEKIYTSHKKTGESLSSLRKLGLNNSTCFSNTQKLLLNEKEYWLSNNWIAVLPQQGKWMTYEVNRYVSFITQ